MLSYGIMEQICDLCFHMKFNSLNREKIAKNEMKHLKRILKIIPPLAKLLVSGTLDWVTSRLRNEKARL